MVDQAVEPPFGPETTASTSEIGVSWSAEAIRGYATSLDNEMTPEESIAFTARNSAFLRPDLESWARQVIENLIHRAGLRR